MTHETTSGCSPGPDAPLCSAPGSPPAPRAPGTQSVFERPAALISAESGRSGRSGTWETHQQNTDAHVSTSAFSYFILFFKVKPPSRQIHILATYTSPRPSAKPHQKNPKERAKCMSSSVYVIIYHVSNKHILFITAWRSPHPAVFTFLMVKGVISKGGFLFFFQDK